MKHKYAVSGKLLTAVLIFTLAACADQSYQNKNTQQLLQLATTNVSTLSFFEAERALRTVMPRLEPGSPEWQQASFLLAISLRHQTPSGARKIDEARLLLLDLLDRTPQSKFAPDALIILARIHELRNYPGDPVDNQAAMRLYDRLLEDYPESDLRDLAVLRKAQIIAEDFTNPEAVAQALGMIEEWIEQNPDSPYLNAHWKFIADYKLLLQRDTVAALPAMIEADNHSLAAVGRRGGTFWIIAEFSEQQGDIDTAVAYYQRIVTEAPRSLRSTEARMKLIELRDLYPQKNITVPGLINFSDLDSKDGLDLP